VVITQTLRIVTSTSTGNADTVKIQYDITSNGAIAHEVGLRVMLDTEIGGYDGAPFRIPGLTNAITTETEMLAPSARQEWGHSYLGLTCVVAIR
jgi:hypothetical protein